MNLPAGRGTVVGMLQSPCVGHEVFVYQLAPTLHQATVELVHGVRGDGLGVVVTGEIVMKVPGRPRLHLGLGQREGELTVVQDLEINVSSLESGEADEPCLPTLPSYMLYLYSLMEGLERTGSRTPSSLLMGEMPGDTRAHEIGCPAM